MVDLWNSFVCAARISQLLCQRIEGLEEQRRPSLCYRKLCKRSLDPFYIILYNPSSARKGPSMVTARKNERKIKQKVLFTYVISIISLSLSLSILMSTLMSMCLNFQPTIFRVCLAAFLSSIIAFSSRSSQVRFCLGFCAVFTTTNYHLTPRLPVFLFLLIFADQLILSTLSMSPTLRLFPAAGSCQKKKQLALNLICAVRCRFVEDSFYFVFVLLRKKAQQHVKRGKNCRQYRSALAADRNMNTNCFLFEFHIFFLFSIQYTRSTLIASMSLLATHKTSSFIRRCCCLFGSRVFVLFHSFLCCSFRRFETFKCQDVCN